MGGLFSKRKSKRGGPDKGLAEEAGAAAEETFFESGDGESRAAAQLNLARHGHGACTAPPLQPRHHGVPIHQCAQSNLSSHELHWHGCRGFSERLWLGCRPRISPHHFCGGDDPGVCTLL